MLLWVWDPSTYAQGSFQPNYGFWVGGALALYKPTARESTQKSFGSGKTPAIHELAETKLDWSWVRVKQWESQTLRQSRHCLLVVRWLGNPFPCPDDPSGDWQRTEEIPDSLKPLAWAKLPAIGAITWMVIATRKSRTWNQERRIDHFLRNMPLESRNLKAAQVPELSMIYWNKKSMKTKPNSMKSLRLCDQAAQNRDNQPTKYDERMDVNLILWAPWLLVRKHDIPLIRFSLRYQHPKVSQTVETLNAGIQRSNPRLSQTAQGDLALTWSRWSRSSNHENSSSKTLCSDVHLVYLCRFGFEGFEWLCLYRN